MNKNDNSHDRSTLTNRRLVGRDGPDFYPTPPWVVHALLGMEEFHGEIFECACGDGSISKVLEQAGHNVYSSDLFDHGYGVPGIDFLNSMRTSPNIITNPPYKLAENFVQKGLELVEHKLVLLLRLAFLEGVGRQIRIFGETPPSRVRIFSERPTFYPKGVEPKGSGTIAYAWFVWDKDAPNGTFIHWVPLGYKAKHASRTVIPTDPNQGTLRI